MNKPIRIFDQNEDVSAFKRFFVGCLILSKDKKILLQQRGEDWDAYPGFLAEFGGEIEEGETPLQAVIRELKEELGAKVKEKDIISLGAMSESSSHYQELIYLFFWHDKEGTISGCFEGEAIYYEQEANIHKHPKVMDSVTYLLKICKTKNLISNS